MKKLIGPAVLAVLLFTHAFTFIQAAPQAADDPVLARVIEIGRNDNQTTRWLDVLANRFGPRISGTDAYNNAAQWTVQQFKSWGLQAELQEAGEVPVGFSHGESYGRVVGTPDTYLFFATPAFSSGTRGRVRGPVVVLPAETARVESMKSKIKGAWVLASAPADLNRSPGRGERAPIFKLLEDAGALGAVFKGGRMPWRLSSARVASWEQLPTLPEITLLDTQYDQVKATADAGKGVELEFEIRNYFKPGPVKYYNVIAWLPGSQSQDPAVILSGHLDSVAGSAGATDDLSGSTPAIEALRILAKAGVKPKRTIMTHLFAAEELGLLGSQAWLKQHPDTLPTIGVNINRDYNPGAVTGITVPPTWQADFEKITAPLATLNPQWPFTLTVSPYPTTRAVRPGGTDATAFSMLGVPTLRLAEKTEHNYNSTYHTLWDTYDDALPYAKHQEHTALVLAVLAYGIGNLDHALTRDGFYLPDGLYADIYTPKGHILTTLDYPNAPESVKAFIAMFETPAGAQGGARGGAGGPGGPGGPGAPGAAAGQGTAAPPTIGTVELIDRKMAARMVVTGKDAVARAVKLLPKEKNPAIKHDRAGVFGMASPTQFYVTTAKAASYDKKGVALGRVVADQKVADALAKGDTLTRVAIIRVGPAAIDFGKK
jgi:cyclophilin family peptidyl-prolyl cis-trans isomerase